MLFYWCCLKGNIWVFCCQTAIYSTKLPYKGWTLFFSIRQVDKASHFYRKEVAKLKFQGLALHCNSDEGILLKTSASLSLCDGNFVLINVCTCVTKISYFASPPTTQCSCLRNSPFYFIKELDIFCILKSLDKNNLFSSKKYVAVSFLFVSWLYISIFLKVGLWIKSLFNSKPSFPSSMPLFSGNVIFGSYFCVSCTCKCFLAKHT